MTRSRDVLPAGTEIAGYTIEGVLGRGGMAVVYRARHREYARPVALKLIASDSSWDLQEQERFEREARLAAAVVHRHILPVYEAGKHDGHPFVAMKLEASDLGALLRVEGRLSPARAVALVSDVASALDAAHAHGLVHRDVKPQNVLLGGENGEESAYVADFGVARAAFSGVDVPAGDMVGTVGYASPEQIRGGTVDRRTDVYALGCLLYECLTGRAPFVRANMLATLWAHLYEQPPAPTTLVPRLHAGLDDVVRRALAKNPHERFGSAGALAKAARNAVGARSSREAPVRREPRTLPSGTVTFLFTDVEGSTKLLHELGEAAYADELERHRTVLRAAGSAHGGVEVDTQGDAFFFAFAQAEGALQAAGAVVARLAAGPIRVRIGVHTGTPHVTSEGYVGKDVHRAARIAAAGHGGQVVVSEMTVATLASPPVPLTSLGAHRLKDFPEPVALYQLGEGAFPPLKTIANTNLPTPASSFVGRKQELYEADLLLQRTRLLSVTGPGGAGKTRFALELAGRAREQRFSDYADGVFSCFLSSLRDPGLVLSTIAQTLSLREEPGTDALDALVSRLAEKNLLLLLDNLEHLLDCAGALSSLLSRSPGLILVCTSRERLRLDGELLYEVPPLEAGDGVDLFCERARVEPSPAIGELCSRLDGLPLAIELAAARMRLLSPEQLLERLSKRLDVLKAGRDADPRQHTLRATIQWSYDLLSPEERALFARLSVFAGGCTLEAAEEVCDADLDALESLLDKSLLRRSDDRFWMLETIREFAAERLEESGHSEEQGRLHAVHHARLGVQLAPSLREYRSPEPATILAEEQGNMRAALDFALQRDDAVLAGDLMHGLWFYWITAGSGSESAEWAYRYLASGRERLSPVQRVPGDVAAAEILRLAGDQDIAAKLKRELVETGRSHPDAVIHGLPIARSTAATLSDLAYIELDAGRIAEARRHAEEGLDLRRRLGLQHGIAHALWAVGVIAYSERDFARAREVFAQALAGWEAAGSRGEIADSWLMIAECELLLGRPDETEALLHEAIPMLAEFPDRAVDIRALRVAGMLAEARGDAARCAALFGAADRKLEESGLMPFGRAENEIYHSYLERARDDLGARAFDVAYERGALASDEAAFELALSLA